MPTLFAWFIPVPTAKSEIKGIFCGFRGRYPKCNEIAEGTFSKSVPGLFSTIVWMLEQICEWKREDFEGGVA